MGADVRGTLPATIGNFKHLGAASFVSTAITGSVPASMGTIPALRMVWLDHNVYMSGALPASFASLTNLAVLEMQYVYPRVIRNETRLYCMNPLDCTVCTVVHCVLINTITVHIFNCCVYSSSLFFTTPQQVQ